jgi:hypothetical protein
VKVLFPAFAMQDTQASVILNVPHVKKECINHQMALLTAAAAPLDFMPTLLVQQSARFAPRTRSRLLLEPQIYHSVNLAQIIHSLSQAVLM